jgi:hypothetical protein
LWKSQVPDKTETHNRPEFLPAQTVQHGQEQKANVALYMPVLGHKQTQTCGMCFIDPRYSRRLQHQPQWDLKAKLCFFPGSQPKN